MNPKLYFTVNKLNNAHRTQLAKLCKRYKENDIIRFHFALGMYLGCLADSEIITDEEYTVLYDFYTA